MLFSYTTFDTQADRLFPYSDASFYSVSVQIAILPQDYTRAISRGSLIAQTGTLIIDGVLYVKSGSVSGKVATLDNYHVEGTILIPNDGGYSHQSEIEQLFSMVNTVRAYYGLSAVSVPASVGNAYANAGSGKIGMYASWGGHMRTLQNALADTLDLSGAPAISWESASNGMYPKASVINQIRSSIAIL